MLTLALTACLWLSQDDVDDRRAVTLNDRDADGVQTSEDCDDNNFELGAWTITYQDLDQDGYGDPLATRQVCGAADGYVDNDLDCDDSDSAVNPDAEESCNGQDDDCDGTPDAPLADWAAQEVWPDADLDGYGDQGADSEPGCDSWDGYAPTDDDCDDGDAAVHPDAVEACGYDLDCDGEVMSCAPTDDVDTSDYLTAVWGPSNGDALGSAVAVADLDGDGSHDLIMGAPGYQGNAGAGGYMNTGAAVVMQGPLAEGSLNIGTRGVTSVIYSGSSEGYGVGGAMVVGQFSEEASVQLIVGTDPWDSVAAVYVVDGLADGGRLGEVGRSIKAGFSGDTSAGSALAAGDLDADGFDELVIGSAWGQGNNKGHLYFLMEGPDAVTQLSNEPNAPGWNNAEWGTALAIGELNGDGYDDLVVTAPETYSSAGEGRVQVISGADLADLAGAPPTPLFEVVGRQNERIGAQVTIVEEAPSSGQVGTIAFSASVDAGGQGGVWMATIDVEEGSAGTAGLQSIQSRGGARLGPTVYSPGDLDGDQQPDLIVGTPSQGIAEYWTAASEANGQAYATFEGNGSTSQFGWVLIGGVDLVGTAAPDLVFGAPGGTMSPGAVYIYDPASDAADH